MTVTVADVGPGSSGPLLRRSLSQPHRLVEPDTGWFTIQRGERVAETLIVLGRTTAISGFVNGDVIVVDADLFVRPGALIGGRAIAIGGGVYGSALGVVVHGTTSYRDNTFSIKSTGNGYQLVYVSLHPDVSPAIVLPGLFGLRFSTYDRVNGASVPYGPELSFGGRRGQADVLASYRSNLGKVDPSIGSELELSRKSRLEIDAARGTFSNDDWIWSDPVNSLSAFVSGRDARNYYRADRAELTLHRSLEWADTRFEPFVGGLSERAWSVGPSLGALGGPWSIFGRTDSLGMLRPNPPINDGSISSALVGAGLQWEPEGLAVRLRTRGEVGIESPLEGTFVQFTSDLNVAFQTFGEQQYRLETHWVTTLGDTTPAQRFAYLGGPGTLAFDDLLDMGGDQLLYIDQLYSYPVSRVRLGLLGTPTLVLRHRLGSAGLGRLPSFAQVLSLGLQLTLLRGEVLLDPMGGGVKAGAGLSFSR